MLKFYILLCLATLFSSCGRKYKIEGTSSVSLLDGKMLFLKVLSEDKLINIDSAEVVHGLFKMKGCVDSAMLASLYMDDTCIMPLVVENGNIEIQIDNARIVVKGTPLNDVFYEFVNQKTALDDRAYEVEREESRMIMDGEDLKTIHREIDGKRRVLSDEMDALTKKFIKANYDNVLGTGVFMMLCNSMPYPEMTPVLKELLDEAPVSFRNNAFVKEFVSLAEESQRSMEAAVN